MNTVTKLFSLMASAALGICALETAAHAANLLTNGNFETVNSSGLTAEVGVGTNDNYGSGSYSQPALPGWTTSGFVIQYTQSTASSAVPTSQFGNDSGNELSKNFQALAGGGSYILGLDGDPEYSGASQVPSLQQTVRGLIVGTTYRLTFNWAGTQLQNRTGPTTEQMFACLSPTANSCLLSYPNQTLGTEATVSDSGQGTAVVNIASQGFTGWMTAVMNFTATNSTETLAIDPYGTPVGAPPFVLLDNVSLTAVPEPSSWAMMLVGFGALGVVARRRRRSTAAA